MTLNNPFISYKIYSTTTNGPVERRSIPENVRVACIITEKETLSRDFLAKVLSAARIPKKEYHIIILKAEEIVSASEQGWFDNLDYILCFGIQPGALDIRIPIQTYTLSELHNTKIIQLPGLLKIESDNSEKQKLWQLMKKEFIND